MRISSFPRPLTPTLKLIILTSGLGKLVGQLSSEALIMTRILSAFNLLKRVGFAVLLLGGGLTAQAQPYELQFLYDEVSDEQWRTGGDIAALGDQDGDGYDDILMTHWLGPQRQNCLRIIYGADGPPYRYLDFASTLQDTSNVQYWWNQLSPYTSCGDYNADGFIDILESVVSSQDQTLYLFLYLGGPELFDTIWDWRSTDFGASYSFGYYGDYNVDGYGDLITLPRPTGEAREFRFYESIWQTQSQEPTWTYGYGETIDEPYPREPNNYGDINGDGYPDFTFYAYFDLVSNDSIATDSIYQDFWFGGHGADSIPEISLRCSGRSNCVSAFEIMGDVNGDGFDDLLAHTLRPGLRDPVPTDNRIYFGGDPLDLEGVDAFWDTPLNFFAASQGQRLGDINGDGFEDMGFNQGGGVLYIFLGGNPIQQQAAYIQESYEDTLIATTLSRAGDFNGDGLDDWMFTSIVDYHWPPPPEGFRVRLSIVSGDPNFGLDVPSDRPSIPREITLGPAFPNPFNSSVTIPITVDYPARDATVSIYNVLGQEVYRFDRLQLPPGKHRLIWNGQSMTGQPSGSGVYIVTLNSQVQTHSEKICLLR